MALLMSGQFTSKSIYDLMIWVWEGVSLLEIIQLMGSWSVFMVIARLAPSVAFMVFPESTTKDAKGITLLWYNTLFGLLKY
jgi:hypothetical protein